VDWPAIVASISTGVAAIAGIGGTLWLANRNWRHDDERSKVEVKRQIYSSSVAMLHTAVNAAAHKIDLRDTPESSTAERGYNAAIHSAINASFELLLIAPGNVSSAGTTALQLISKYSDDETPSQAAVNAIANLVAAMRADLGEPPLAGSVPILVRPDQQGKRESQAPKRVEPLD
jgi:hypothetical protein